MVLIFIEFNWNLIKSIAFIYLVAFVQIQNHCAYGSFPYFFFSSNQIWGGLKEKSYKELSGKAFKKCFKICVKCILSRSNWTINNCEIVFLILHEDLEDKNEWEYLISSWQFFCCMEQIRAALCLRILLTLQSESFCNVEVETRTNWLRKHSRVLKFVPAWLSSFILASCSFFF